MAKILTPSTILFALFAVSTALDCYDGGFWEDDDPYPNENQYKEPATLVQCNKRCVRAWGKTHKGKPYRGMGCGTCAEWSDNLDGLINTMTCNECVEDGCNGDSPPPKPNPLESTTVNFPPEPELKDSLKCYAGREWKNGTVLEKTIIIPCPRKCIKFAWEELHGSGSIIGRGCYDCHETLAFDECKECDEDLCNSDNFPSTTTIQPDMTTTASNGGAFGIGWSAHLLVIICTIGVFLPLSLASAFGGVFI